MSAFLPSAPPAVTSSPLHGDGVCASRPYAVGDVVYSEKPLCFLQALPNANDVLVCGECQCFLGGFDAQVGVLSKAVTRQGLASAAEEVVVTDIADPLSTIHQCRERCGELYCSVACRDRHWHRHRLLCTGAITEEEAAASPLIRFKVHACETNEIFLLVADVFAKICSDVEAAAGMGAGAAAGETVEAALAPYSRFVRNIWWDCVVDAGTTTVATTTTTSSGSSEDLSAVLKRLVEESWALLREALNLDGRGLAGVLSAEYFARTIGMFEQNNIGVRCSHPLAAAVAGLQPHGALVGPLLAGAERVAAYLEGAFFASRGDDRLLP